jgi:DNA-directed RNA polymerase subunit RPC12/RpoP
MGHFLRLKCSHCALDETGCRTQAYVLNLEGRRQNCRHPGQDEHACEILGIDYDLVVDAMGRKEQEPGYRLPDGTMATAEKFVEFFESRRGVVQGFLCTACAKWSELDQERDPLQCVHCRSEGIFKFEESDGRSCPFCKKGRISSTLLGIS